MFGAKKITAGVIYRPKRGTHRHSVKYGYWKALFTGTFYIADFKACDKYGNLEPNNERWAIATDDLAEIS